MAATQTDTASRQVRRAQAREAAKRHPLPQGRHARISVTEDPPLTPGKGLFDGNCNRTACQEPIKGNNWWNIGTRAYYCQRCAYLINEWPAQRGEALICFAVQEPQQ